MNQILTFFLPAMALVLVAGTLWSLLQWRRTRQRQIALGSLMDALDGLEQRLRLARQGSDAAASADEALRAAYGHLLRQRLWLKDHAMSATLPHLREMERSLSATSRTIDARAGVAA